MNDPEILGKVIDTAFFISKESIGGVENFIESFKTTQIKCKKWLVEEIANSSTTFDNVLVIGSWNGILLYELMNQYCDVGSYDFLDLDKKTHIHREVYFSLHKMEKNYNSIVADANEFSDFSNYDLIINTSCEHMMPLPSVYGPLYALQSNNYTNIPEHVNCVENVKELKKQYKLTHTLYESELDMGHYKRFMVIGSHW